MKRNRMIHKFRGEKEERNEKKFYFGWDGVKNL